MVVVENEMKMKNALFIYLFKIEFILHIPGQQNKTPQH